MMNGNGRILRAGLFERVSTEEQARHGYSIASQKEALEEYCIKHKMKIVGHYCDDGVSAGISYKKRPEMMRLLNDIEDGNIDIVLFTRLDRWFRSIKEYYKVQEILDDHKVEWKAIWEDYDTTTANGRMAITIFLAIAQAEREKTSERITSVFESKRKRKESFFGSNSTPFGYIEKEDEKGIRRLVKDPDIQEALQTFFDIAVKYDNISKAAKTVNLEYGLTKARHKWNELAKKEIYYGTYRGVEGYCEPYISKEDWTKLQNRGKLKKNTNRIYLFSSLIECPICHNNMRGTYCRQKRKNGEIKEYRSYRCEYKTSHTCTNKHTLSELKAEDWLLDNLERLMKDEIARVEVEKTKPKSKPKTNITALKEQLRRLEVVYLAGNKTDSEYIKESKELNDAIKKAEQEHGEDEGNKDLSIIQEALSTDFKSIYITLDDEDKRRFWRTLIKKIYIKGNHVTSVEFN